MVARFAAVVVGRLPSPHFGFNACLIVCSACGDRPHRKDPGRVGAACHAEQTVNVVILFNKHALILKACSVHFTSFLVDVRQSR